MKYKRIAVTVIAVLTVALIAYLGVSHAGARSAAGKLSLGFETSARTFQLGEIIDTSFVLINDTNITVSVAKPSVLTGTLSVLVSRDAVNYTKYVGPHWGNFHSADRRFDLQPSQSLRSNATVYYNETVSLDHLSELYAEPLRKERLQTSYAFAESGSFWLKAIYIDGTNRIESAPVLIEILEPAGPELAVWERIKGDGAYAYFLQTGEVKYYPNTPEYFSFLTEIEAISVDRSGSRLSQRIDQIFAERKRISENLQQLRSQK